LIIFFDGKEFNVGKIEVEKKIEVFGLSIKPFSIFWIQRHFFLLILYKSMQKISAALIMVKTLIRYFHVLLKSLLIIGHLSLQKLTMTAGKTSGRRNTRLSEWRTKGR